MHFPLGDPKPVQIDEGLLFMVAPVRAPGSAFIANALVANAEISGKARDLLVSAQAQAQAKARRLNFFRRSRESLGVTGSEGYDRAEDESMLASRRVDVLFALAAGENAVGKKIISVDDWREILQHFQQDPSVGAVQQLEG